MLRSQWHALPLRRRLHGARLQAPACALVARAPGGLLARWRAVARGAAAGAQPQPQARLRLAGQVAAPARAPHASASVLQPQHVLCQHRRGLVAGPEPARAAGAARTPCTSSPRGASRSSALVAHGSAAPLSPRLASAACAGGRAPEAASVHAGCAQRAAASPEAWAGAAAQACEGAHLVLRPPRRSLPRRRPRPAQADAVRLACAGQHDWMGACCCRKRHARWSPRRRSPAHAAARQPAQRTRGVTGAALPAKQAGREHAARTSGSCRPTACITPSTPPSAQAAHHPRSAAACAPKKRRARRAAAPSAPAHASAPASARDAPASWATLASTRVTSSSACVAHAVYSAQPHAPSPLPAARAPGGGPPARPRRVRTRRLHDCARAAGVQAHGARHAPHTLGAARWELPGHACSTAIVSICAQAENAGMHTVPAGQQAIPSCRRSTQGPPPPDRGMHPAGGARTVLGQLGQRRRDKGHQARARQRDRSAPRGAVACHELADCGLRPGMRVRARHSAALRAALPLLQTAAERGAAGAPLCL